MFPDMKVYKELKNGDVFGEISLLTDEIRQTTVLCNSDSHLMVSDKENFLKIFKNFFYR